mmetsp:Transcript_1694/g.1845  ORF Transcript_1694/g.1845 Transcript_1694/m.1845 type:complete len:351 (-) Transcript_1694:466-1518(-)|eukprot:CAMPEP_0119038134 /NCGR_PEP_ID=MMETSP1177-20130426/6855_1 /TAXON_ID=2985 /ORGANISM="Ochromonas sp, Strain CCMP1899" /LENGTH=350 /DNA_ID=CAMNT_0007000293 /DNA_START=161 /DNA_END=1213 /DNA_ORIENTATION=-
MDVVRLFRNTREYLMPVLQESAFTERGVLTPEEFVRAGDQLILKCPTWSWQSGEASKIRPYLPADKQFLLIKGCPSHQRVTTMNAATVSDFLVESDLSGINEDWCAPQIVEPTYDDEVLIDKIDLLGLDDEKSSNSLISIGSSVELETPPTPIGGVDLNPKDIEQKIDLTVDENKILLNTNEVVHKDKADEYSDMEDETLALDESTTNTIDVDSGPVLGVGGIVRSRRYDVSITYDKYYQTPRVWLFGYHESGSPLKPESIFDDIMQDYAKKTVTIDPHPHLSRPHASVHPCQHGPAMLRIIEALHECGHVPVVDSYLFIFLKFIQSVIPTIEYDYTMDVRVRGGEGTVR